MDLSFLKKTCFVKTALVLTVMFFCARFFTANVIAANKYEGISVSAESAVLIEASSGQIIWSKNANKRLPMASTTKIMTALVAIENFDIEKTVEISPDAIGIEGSSIYLYKGEKLSMLDLLYAMLLESANDAATAIAIAVGGNVEGFADMMNEKAEDLGLKTTHFSNPHGLDDPEHYTTAEELGKIAVEAMKNDTFKQIVSTYKRTIPLNETEGVRLLINHNKMLKAYNGAIGIKTGYTKKSGRCLVSAAEKDGVELIAVTLNAPDDWRDHKTMLDLGFSLYESRVLCQSGSFRQIQTVIGGKESYVVLTNKEDVIAVVRKDSAQIKCTVELFRFSYAPIKSGDIVGRLVYTLDGKEIAATPVYSTQTVERIEYRQSLFDRLFSFLFK